MFSNLSEGKFNHFILAERNLFENAFSWGQLKFIPSGKRINQEGYYERLECFTVISSKTLEDKSEWAQIYFVSNLERYDSRSLARTMNCQLSAVDISVKRSPRASTFKPWRFELSDLPTPSFYDQEREYFRTYCGKSDLLCGVQHHFQHYVSNCLFVIASAPIHPFLKVFLPVLTAQYFVQGTGWCPT